jgi:hypothetical protein
LTEAVSVATTYNVPAAAVAAAATRMYVKTFLRAGFSTTRGA